MPKKTYKVLSFSQHFSESHNLFLTLRPRRLISSYNLFIYKTLYPSYLFSTVNITYLLENTLTTTKFYKSITNVVDKYAFKINLIFYKKIKRAGLIPRNFFRKLLFMFKLPNVLQYKQSTYLHQKRLRKLRRRRKFKLRRFFRRINRRYSTFKHTAYIEQGLNLPGKVRVNQSKGINYIGYNTELKPNNTMLFKQSLSNSLVFLNVLTNSPQNLLNIFDNP